MCRDRAEFGKEPTKKKAATLKDQNHVKKLVCEKTLGEVNLC